MMIAVRVGIALTGSLLLAACISIKSYVHPLYQRAVYADVRRPAQPAPVRIQAMFLRNGQRVPELDPAVAGEVRRVVAASGVFVVTGDTAVTTTLEITVNNLVDIWAARKAGAFAALRLGIRGQNVDDDYQFICQFTDSAGNTSRSTYRDEIHTSAGEVERLTGQQAFSPEAAFGQVVEDVVLTCIRHLQEVDLAP